MIKSRLYEKGDLNKIDFNPIFLDIPNLIHQMEAQIENKNSISYTIELGNEVLAIIGATYLWPGVVDVWSVVSNNVKKHAKSFHTVCLGLIQLAFAKMGIRRLQFTVRHDFTIGIRWARSLGFSPEGVMAQWGPDGKDYIMFARLN